MYESRDNTLGALGLAVPDWLKRLAGAVVRGTRVTIQTPVGPQTIDLSKPGGAEALRALQESLRSAQFEFTSAPRTVAQQFQAGIAQVPGGWVTIGLVGAALLLFSGGLGIGRVGRARR